MPISRAALRSFREAIRVLEREITGQLRSETGCCGVSLAQCHTLLELDAAGPLSLTAIAGRFALDQSTLSRTVDGMARSGLLARIANPDDRRAVRLELTAAGKKAVAAIHRQCDQFYDSLLSNMSAAKRRLVLEGVVALAEGIRCLRLGSCVSSCGAVFPRMRKKKTGV